MNINHFSTIEAVSDKMPKATFFRTDPSSKSSWPVLECRLEIILYLSVLILCIIVLQEFLHYIDAAPPFTVDDSLGNIVVAILDYGRFGFLASPQQVVYEIRSDRFYLFGPWYFYLGAALSWLFGFSTTLIRFIHPLVVVVIIGLAFAHFRRTSSLAAGLFGITALFMFREAQWPMIRPDSVVTLFGILAIVLSSHAIQRDSFWAWFFASFAAAAAAVTHLIAWAIPIGFAVTWLVAILVPNKMLSSPERRMKRAFRSFLANALGAITSIFVWLISIDFRGFELLDLIGRYRDFGKSQNTQDYFDLLMAHMNFVFPLGSQNVFPALLAAVAGMIALALLGFCLFAIIKLGGQARSTVVATSVPVLAMWGGYTLSLGIYPNFHSGYVIFAQYGVIWAGASVAAITVFLCTYFGVTFARKLRLAALAFLSALAIQQSLSANIRTTSWEVLAENNVDFTDYYEHVVSELPERAKVWGDLIFANESGRRIDLVQYGEGMILYNSLKPELKPRGYPEFLVTSHSEQLPWILTFLQLSRKAGGKGTIPSLWIGDDGNEGLHLVRIVSAPPYGATRIYATTSPAPTTPRVTIAFNDGVNPNWITGTGDAAPFYATPVAPTRMQFDHHGDTFNLSATSSVAIELPRGAYLLTLDTKDSKQPSLIVAGNQPEVQISSSAYVPGHQITFVSGYEAETAILVDHKGGPLLLSHFAATVSDQINLKEVRPLSSVQTPPATKTLYVDELTRCFGQRAKTCTAEQE